MTPHGCITASPVDVTQAGGDKWFTLWRLLNPHLSPYFIRLTRLSALVKMEVSVARYFRTPSDYAASA